MKNPEVASVSNKVAPVTFDLLSKSMDEVAREIGRMNPDDPVRVERLRDISALWQLSKALRSEQNQAALKRMEELACEMIILPLGHARRAQILAEILRLSEFIQTEDLELSFGAISTLREVQLNLARGSE